MTLLGTRRTALLASMLSVLLPAAAQAGEIICTTKIAAVYLHGAGPVYADFGGTGGAGVPLMCNLNASVSFEVVGTVTPEVCRGWVSVLLTAKSTQQNVNFRYENGQSTAPTSCVNVIPSWGAIAQGETRPRVPYIFGLVN
jgi:hypothetical protein